MLPLVFAMLMITFGDLDIERYNQQLYAHGSMVVGFTATFFFYCVWIFIATFRYQKTIQKENRLAIRLGILMLIAGGGTHLFNFGLLFSEVVYDLVKLDKSLIWPCFNQGNSREDKEQNSKANAILENIINLLQQLKVNIVAEGVETKEMATYLDNRGVTYLQGYYYSKPISEDAYLSFLTQD